MGITLSPLPYDESALEPAISSRTIGYHYHKHHKAYVDVLGPLIEGTRFADMCLEEIVHGTVSAKGAKEKKIFNNAAQVWNHDFYWRSLSPKPSKPSRDLANSIDRDFGSLDALNKRLAEAAAAQFGSGWAWLTSKGGKLSVEATSNALAPMARGVNCLLCIDVWEHAYYLDYQNERAKYLYEVISRLLDWEFAAENLSKEARAIRAAAE
jgi:Fe-Mn family superoxide dismutase